MSRDLIGMMTDAGVRFEWFRPPGRVARAALSLDEGLVGQHRTHRKILVCDGQVGFTGGVGIAEEWCGDARNPDEWRDTQVKIAGPAVASLRSAFATNWHEASGEPLPVGASEIDEQDQGDVTLQVVRGQPGRFVSDIGLLMRALMEAATERVWVATAYFIPDDAMIEELRAAEERGVDLRILVPGEHNDKRVSRLAARRHMVPLLDIGIEVSEYEPTMLHCKIVVVDDIAVVGSANLNMRSMHQDDEVAVVIHDGEVTERLASDLEADLARSQRMDPERFEDRSFAHHAAEAAANTLRRFL